MMLREAAGGTPLLAVHTYTPMSSRLILENRSTSPSYTESEHTQRPKTIHQRTTGGCMSAPTATLSWRRNLTAFHPSTIRSRWPSQVTPPVGVFITSVLMDETANESAGVIT